MPSRFRLLLPGLRLLLSKFRLLLSKLRLLPFWSIRVHIIVACIALIAAIWLFSQPSLEVATCTAVHGKIESTAINTRAGTIEACLRTRLSTIIGGRIEYLGVAEGDHVQAGQVLMRLWQGDLRAAEAVAKARRTGARQRHREACAIARQAEKDAVRQEELVKSKFVSPTAAEKARTEADARNAACASAEAEEETAMRQLESIVTDLDRTVIIAPFSGTIAKINGELGEISTPSPTGIAMPPAIDLIDDSCLYITVPMDESDAPKIQPKQAVRINVQALKEKNFSGYVRRIAPYITAVEKQARTVNVDIDFSNQEQARGLLVGYSVDVEIIFASRNDALLIPSTALRDGNKVMVLGKNGIVSERTVQTGIANWQQTEILSGIKAGERMITPPSLSYPELRPGIRARAFKTNPR
ncbi:MAG: efflux RND transporter periplasmic adaptor subunit [Azoarcus sp.]|jgi:HlyD family secretion protein|nr:efflux RND transporter periplasmic adaptor subunit [Azoarcus sp.]